MDKNSNKKITDSQYECLKQFKKNVIDILRPYDTDTVLLKWLKNRNYNVRKAESLFREMHAFRLTYALDTITETFVKPEVVEKYEYTAFLGYAKDGSIVRYSQIGRGDHYGMIQSLSPYQLGIYGTFIMEEDYHRQGLRNKETGENCHEITYIFDLAGMNIQDILHKCVYELGMDMMHLVQDYYPEVWGNVFLINVPPYFDTLFNIFKPVLRMNVISRLKVLSKESVAPVLLKYIDEDVLPVFLGGKRVDSKGNPKCAEFLRFGGKISPEYYLINQPPLLPTEPDVQTKYINARYVFNHCVVVHEPNSIISVEVRTEYGSIHMSIYYKKFGPNKEIVLPGEDEPLDEKDEKNEIRKISPGMRVQTHLSQIKDKNIAPWPGIYIYRFNNSHNWLYSRKLIYRIKLADK